MGAWNSSDRKRETETSERKSERENGTVLCLAGESGRPEHDGTHVTRHTPRAVWCGKKHIPTKDEKSKSRGLVLLARGSPNLLFVGFCGEERGTHTLVRCAWEGRL